MKPKDPMKGHVGWVVALIVAEALFVYFLATGDPEQAAAFAPMLLLATLLLVAWRA